MASDVRTDLLELSDHVWQRFLDRMTGLTDDELDWWPTIDPNLSLRWRVEHVASLLAEDRNAVWLGRQPAALPSESADPELTAAKAAYALWRGYLVGLDDDSLAQPIGEVAGPYGDGSRRSFVLHVLDELIHHTAESAMYRDLYARRPGSPGPSVGG